MNIINKTPPNDSLTFNQLNPGDCFIFSDKPNYIFLKVISAVHISHNFIAVRLIDGLLVVCNKDDEVIKTKTVELTYTL